VLFLVAVKAVYPSIKLFTYLGVINLVMSHLAVEITRGTMQHLLYYGLRIVFNIEIAKYTAYLSILTYN